MALNKISYNDKSNYQTSSLADEYKVTDDDMNEIKSVVNGAIDKLEPVILYDTAPTNATTLTLNDDISNYTYVEFICSLQSSTGHQFSSKGQVGHTILLCSAMQGYLDNSYYGVRLHTSYVTITGTSLTKTIGYGVSFKTNGTFVFADNENRIYIHQVIGYK